jgi:hypothetical protein
MGDVTVCLTRPHRFKIQEDGYNGGNWGTSKVITNGGLHSITIPKCIANGQYLLRAEMIALHSAGSPGQAQFYVRRCHRQIWSMGCVH